MASYRVLTVSPFLWLQKILDEEGDMVELEEYQLAVTIVEDAKKHLAV